MVAEAVYLQLDAAAIEFRNAGQATVGFAHGVSPLAIDPGGSTIADRYDYLGEDLTRMALETIGLSRVPGARIFGAIDFKAARYVFLPDFSVEQALFVDSKAEKNSFNNCRIQVTQTSLEVRQLRDGQEIVVPGLVNKIWDSPPHQYITTTIFVKYHYKTTPVPGLSQITVAALPHGFLQNKYNPDCHDGIWNVGPNSPQNREKFRTRLNFTKLSVKAPWRVQIMRPGKEWSFDS